MCPAKPAAKPAAAKPAAKPAAAKPAPAKAGGLSAKEMKAKVEDGSFNVKDIPDYLGVMMDLCNKSDDIKEEVEGWDRTFQFKIGESLKVWLSVKDGKFATGVGDAASADITLEMTDGVGAGIFNGDVDATSAYMSGDLKVVGPLPDAVKFRTITEMVREALDDL